jgi:hypothetical protein
LTFVTWRAVHPEYDLRYLGPYLPTFLSELNPRSAAQQIETAYFRGWNPFDGFQMLEGNRLGYPGDEPLEPLATTSLRDETIFLYQGDWLAVVQKDGSFEVSRVD